MANEHAVVVAGVYPVAEAPASCHLIEMLVQGDGNVGDISHAREGEPRDAWQVPWDEKVMDEAGERVLANSWDLPGPGQITGCRTRLVFFFHHLDPHVPLTTPWGDVALPEPTQRPGRLSIVECEEP